MTTHETYLDLADGNTDGGHPISLWWQADDPDRIRLILSDPRFVDANGQKPGLQIVFTSNPRSADYSPVNFNRAARALRAAGKPAPAEDVPEHRRHLKDRPGVMKKVPGEHDSEL